MTRMPQAQQSCSAAKLLCYCALVLCHCCAVSAVVFPCGGTEVWSSQLRNSKPWHAASYLAQPTRGQVICNCHMCVTSSRYNTNVRYVT